MTEKFSAGRYLHRIRTRDVAPVGLQWEVLQTLLGFAFTIQQELQKFKQQAASSEAAVAQSLNLGQAPAFQRIAACAQNLTESSGAALALGDADSMVCVARSGLTAPPLGAQFDSRSGLSGECIRTGESAICVNAAADPRVNYQACRAMNVASMLYLPLYSPQGKLIGMLGVFANQPLHFSQRDLSCLRFVEGLVQEELNRNPLTEMEPKLLPVAPSVPEKPVSEADVVLNRLLKEFEQQLSARNLSSTEIETSPAAPVETAHEVTPIPVLPPVEQVASPEPLFVGRVVDASVADLDLPIEEPEFEVTTPRSRIPIIMAAVVTAAVALVGWNYSKFSPRARQVAPPPVVQSAPSDAPSAAVPGPVPGVAPVLSLTPELSISSSDGNATVSISLPRKVHFQGFALKNPDRVFFDLQGVQLSDVKGKSFDIDPGLVSRIRIAGDAGTSRVVFDLRQAATFEATQTETPQRLIIELRSIDAPVPTSGKQAPVASLAATDGKLTVVIDPGHGGRDTGTTSVDGVLEKDLTLDIAKRLAALLEKRLGANVVLTRSDDRFVSLNSRVTTANDAQADFLISIHGNSSSYVSVRGVETFYFPTTQDALAVAGDATHPKPEQKETDVGRQFAADVQGALLHGLNDTKDPIRDRGVKSASYVILRDVRMPAVLAEVTFMSSRKDAQQLKSPAYRERVAKALYKGIASHVSRRDHQPVSIAELHNQRPAGAP